MSYIRNSQLSLQSVAVATISNSMMQLDLMTAKHLWRRLVSLLQLSPCTLEVVLCHSLLCFFIQSPGRLVLQDKTEDNQRGTIRV